MDVKKMILIIFLIIACNEKSSNSSIDEEGTLMTTFEDSLSYTMGINIGKNLPTYSEIDRDILLKGLNDFLNNREPAINSGDRTRITRRFAIQSSQAELDEVILETEEARDLSRKNKIAGNKFLEENKKKPGVMVRRSNLQYKKIRTGNGKIPDYNDKVFVHYNGYFLDGTKFDSSYDRDSYMTVSVSKVIPAWIEILQIMPVGSKWEIYVPHYLAYGEAGIRGREPGTYVIPPSSTLIFEIELIEIQK
mgnify:CR=1 FL=1|tara:strand:- start:187 stop:933 length:747 start_codon:yes stop_codon:yes gene_type:complete